MQPYILVMEDEDALATLLQYNLEKEGYDVTVAADGEEGTHPWRGEPTHMPGGTFPLGWTRRHGEGRVFVTLLGHNGLSFETPEFQRMVLNGVNWVTNR